MKKRIITMLLLALILLGPAIPSWAQGLIIPVPRPPRPKPPLHSLTIKRQRVTVTIEDQVATTHVDQVFVNDTPYELEGEYLFALPKGAIVSRFAMWVDGRRLEAEVLDREDAEQIYKEIVRQQRDPALLEYVGRNAFRARIYPIPAHGEKRVELEYTQVLNQEQGLVRYVCPLSREGFSTRPMEELCISVHITSRRPLRAIYSPSHDVTVREKGDQEAEVTYEAEDIVPDRDLILYYSCSKDGLGVNLINYKELGEDGFFLLLLSPKIDADDEEIVAKDVFFVLDTSGSMRGEKLEQAKRAAKYVLDGLHDDDRFNIVTFNTGVRSYARGLCSTRKREKAYAFINELRAGGGTNIYRALEETLEQSLGERPQVIIFLTDGLATEGERRMSKILERVDALARDNVRIFAFGVGYDVNTILLDRLAQDHHGTSAYVLPDEDIERVVSSFYETISTPVLANVSIDYGTATVYDTFPYPMPDLFAGQQVVVVGRYRESANTTLSLEGVVNGEAVRYDFKDVRFRKSGGGEFIPRLWAARKIGYLLTQIWLYGAERELIDEVVETSVRYGIVTPYTSFLVDETEDALSKAGRDRIAEREFMALPQAAATSGVGWGSPPAPGRSGEAAVAKSVAQSVLREAKVVAEPETEQVRNIGNKTFVLRDGIWTDTTYDASRMVAEQVVFGSTRYYSLLHAHEEWGRYLALGQRVILVWEGKAYHIDAQSGPVTSNMPESTPVEPGNEPTSPGNGGFLSQLDAWWESLWR